MKNTTLIILLSASAFFFFHSCKEVGPEITLKNNKNVVADTTYIETPVATPEQKNVVIEEFTGVRCPNCPQGHQIIATIKAANAGRIVAVSLHPINSLGAPYSFSAQDFRSQKSQDLFDYLGQIGLEPAAGIDRKQFSGESAILLEKSKWTNYVNQQMAIPAPLNILLETNYDSVTRLLTVAVELHYTQTIAEQNRLTVALTESNIVTAQLNGSVIDTFYTHKDIMRDFLTSLTGDALATTTEAGRVIRKTYQRTLEPVWKPENMHVAAYVHQFQTVKNVYQGKEKEILP